MPEAELNVGDVVTLKTGGPKMTVQRIGMTPIDGMVARCTWFERSDDVGKEWAGPFNAEFPASTLVRCEA
jgi:uncharacterized protein YodC (DUF2158 family)